MWTCTARAAGTDYGDDFDCGTKSYLDDFHGRVENNVVFADDPALFASGSGFDAGIELENTCDSRVLHNRVFSTEAPFSSMSWRYVATTAYVANNLLSHNLRERDLASVLVEGNIESVESSEFVDALYRDLHLGAESVATDAGVTLSSESALEWDADGEPRDSSPDVGAFERSEVVE